MVIPLELSSVKLTVDLSKIFLMDSSSIEPFVLFDVFSGGAQTSKYRWGTTPTRAFGQGSPFDIFNKISKTANENYVIINNSSGSLIKI